MFRFPPLILKPVGLETLRIRDYRILWASSGLASFGVIMQYFGQGWLVFELTDSTLWVGLTRGIPALPIAALSLLGGVIADRMNRRLMIQCSWVGFMTIIFLVATLASTDTLRLWHMVVASFLLGVATSWALTALQPLVLETVGRKRLTSAISLNATLLYTLASIGPLLGGFLIAIQGTYTVFYLIGAGYLFALIILRRFDSSIGKTSPNNKNVLSELMEGLSYIKNASELRWLFILSLVGMFSNVYLPLLPAYSEDILQIGPSGFGVLVSLLGFGQIIGSLATSSTKELPSKGLIVIAMSVVYVSFMVIFAYSRSFYLTGTCMAVMGAAGIIWSNMLTVIVLDRSPTHIQGRVVSVFRVGTQSLTFGWLLGGILASVFGAEYTVLMGATVVAITNVMAYIRSPALRQI